MASLALAWHLHTDWVDAPIIGTTSGDHLEDAVEALDSDLWDIDIESLAEPYEPAPVSGHGDAVRGVSRRLLGPRSPVWMALRTCRWSHHSNSDQSDDSHGHFPDADRPRPSNPRSGRWSPTSGGLHGQRTVVVSAGALLWSSDGYRPLDTSTNCAV